MSKETYSRLIDKYFSNQTEKAYIEDDLAPEHIEDLSEIYGFPVVPGCHVYRYFILKDDKFTVHYFSEHHRPDMMRDILMTDLKFIEDRLGVPVFG